MKTHLNLIKTDYKEVEKRVFPRFPFTYLVFQDEKGRSFEVKDITGSGMQLAIKDGEHGYAELKKIDGEIRWGGSSLKIRGSVKWANDNRVGVKFDEGLKTDKFLSLESIVPFIKAIHLADMDLELPSNLKCWLRADGPVEVFVWTHSDGELSAFQIILLDCFVEWEDGKGVKTAEVVTKRDLETPLISEDEFVFSMDHGVDMQKVKDAKSLIENLEESLLKGGAKEFILRKLGA